MTATTGPKFPQEPALILAELERVSDMLLTALDGLADDDLRAPYVVGEWRIQDVLAHLARWDDIAWDEITAERAGQSSERDYANYLDLNDQWAPLDRNLSPAEARTRFAEAHQRLMSVFQDLSGDEWTVLAWRWARHAVWLHYPEHSAQIQAWRARRPRAAV